MSDGDFCKDKPTEDGDGDERPNGTRGVGVLPQIDDVSVVCDEDAVSACSKDTDSETVETKASDEAQAPTFGNDGEYRCRTFGGANSGKVSVVTMEKEWKAYNNRGPYVYCDDRCGLVVGAITDGPAPIA